MVREQGGITGANFISPQAPGSLGLVVNIFHLVGGLHLQNNSGNLHQILLSRYFREELKQRIGGKACLGKIPWVLLDYREDVLCVCLVKSSLLVCRGARAGSQSLMPEPAFFLHHFLSKPYSSRPVTPVNRVPNL